MAVRLLSIENFKSIRSLSIECARVNVFIGAPNVGKSNVLEALGLLSYIGWGTGDFRDYVRLEKPQDLFYLYSVDRPVRIGIDGLEILGRYEDGGVFFSRDGRTVLTIRAEKGAGPPVSEAWEVVRSPLTELRGIRFYRFSRNAALRGSGEESLLPPSGENLPSVLAMNKKLREITSEILEEFGYRLLIKPYEDELEIVREVEGALVSIPYSLVSDTLRRLIFHLAAIESNENAVITMEEPEAHAFPYYTKYLAERIALDDRNQYFITTHNPYFLMAVLEKAPRREAAVFVTYLEGTETRVARLSDDKIEELMDMGADAFFNLESLARERQ